MARKRRLDQYVTVFVDRHGKERFRFRRGGFSIYLPHPTSKDYRKAYESALAGTRPVQSRSIPQSVDDLVTRFYSSSQYLRASQQWQSAIRTALEPFRAEFATDLIRNFRFEHIEVILRKRVEKRIIGKRTIGGAASAERLHDQLKRLFAYAMRLGWIQSNPAEQAELPVKPERIGFHSWSEEEIAQYQAKHELGTKARLALEIMLWTGLRRSDVVRLGPQHLKAGRLVLTAGKTGKAVDMLLAPDLLRAIEAMPAVGMKTLLVTEYGHPFTVNGFGGWFRERCDQAGLPHCTAHGLRKALARRAADLHATQQQLKALGQWSSDRDVAIYTADAEQRALADAALNRVIEWRTESNLEEAVRHSPELSA